MDRADKPVRLSGHAQQQLRLRGATMQEVVNAIRAEPWRPAELGKLECRKDFAYNALWNGKDRMTMKITYDRKVDALYIRFKETTVTTKHLAEGIAADYDAAGLLAGIEILDAMKRLGDPSVFKQVTFEGVTPGKP